MSPATDAESSTNGFYTTFVDKNEKLHFSVF